MNSRLSGIIDCTIFVSHHDRLGIRIHSEELKTRLDNVRKQLQKRQSTFRLHPVGFTTEMDEWMAAADLLIGKPGGLTTSEALARGLPMVIVNPIPGQEERNADHLLEWGCAVRCNNIVTLDYKLRNILAPPGELARLSANCVQRARPFAASHIVEIATAQPVTSPPSLLV